MYNAPAQPLSGRCRRCGACCRVAGYVRLDDDDVNAAAAHLGMAVADFTRAYTRLTSDRAALSLTEAGDGACVFLEPGAGCRIHGAKPRQCREFPGRWRFTGAELICDAARSSPALENA